MKKRTIFIFSVYLLWVTEVFSQAVKVCGKLVDDRASAVEFANVALKSADKFYGTASDEDGYFEIQACRGIIR
ncbi:MAG: carboxypeptidase-like regulatory domain-containing protein [Tannerella sp.]|jgi:hypothetical protein|nr:carboxypeptidase-like regulatory domain-containing protein [Tannerella sp.]